jgi:hypothetical protein
VALTRPKPRAGLWRVEGEGTIPVVALDRLGFRQVDALVLDVEGAELDALIGAEATIERDRPLIWLEWLHGQDALAAWLTAKGYTGPERALANDVYWRPRMKE